MIEITYKDKKINTEEKTVYELFKNEIKENKGVIYFQTNQLYISNPELAPLHIDGDPAETAKEIKIEILKHCFRLIQPA